MTRRRFSTSARTRVLERYDRKCQLCFQEITVRTGVEYDHRIPLALGGEDEESNLQPLCIHCHKIKTGGDKGDISRAKRREARHIGARSSQFPPMPFGRHSREKRKMDGSVVDRWTGEIIREAPRRRDND